MAISHSCSAAFSRNLYNRQLHPDEKDAIHKKANGDKAEEDRLTKAACYAVQCWAEFPPNSAAYHDNYVGTLEAENLQGEIAWVKNLQNQGLFNHTVGQQFIDYVKVNTIAPAKDGIKLVTGGSAAIAGLVYVLEAVRDVS